MNIASSLPLYPDYVPFARHVLDQMRSVASEIAHRKLPPLAPHPPGKQFMWGEPKKDKDGRHIYRVDALFGSDPHLGSGYCLAEGATLLLQTIQSNLTVMVGDIIDRTGMQKRGVTSLSPQEEQLLAHLHERNTVKICGNHEHDQTVLTIGGKEVRRCDWLAKELYEEPVYDAISFIDGKGRRSLEEHGDRFDGEAFGRVGKALTYFIGDIIYTPIAVASYVLQHKLDIEKWPLALGIKKHFKGVYNLTTGIQDKIWYNADAVKEIDVAGGGHSHFGGFGYSPCGKLISNKGTFGSECVQCELVDDEGNRVFIRNFRKQKTKAGIRIVAEAIEENGSSYIQDLGPYIPASKMADSNPHMHYVQNTIGPNLKKLIELPDTFGQPHAAEKGSALARFAECAASMTRGLPHYALSASQDIVNCFSSAWFNKSVFARAEAALPPPKSLDGVPVFVSPSLEKWVAAAYPPHKPRQEQRQVEADVYALA